MLFEGRSLWLFVVIDSAARPRLNPGWISTSSGLNSTRTLTSQKKAPERARQPEGVSAGRRPPKLSAVPACRDQDELVRPRVGFDLIDNPFLALDVLGFLLLAHQELVPVRPEVDGAVNDDATVDELILLFFPPPNAFSLSAPVTSAQASVSLRSFGRL
jgi:hypothetical protein